jgi:hypothetical protein
MFNIQLTCQATPNFDISLPDKPSVFAAMSEHFLP